MPMKCPHKQRSDQLQCDKCCRWWCCECVEDGKGYMNGTLYAALGTKGSFPWQCSGCSNVNTISQFISSGLFSKKQLLSFGISEHLISSNETNDTQVVQNETESSSIHDSSSNDDALYGDQVVMTPLTPCPATLSGKVSNMPRVFDVDAINAQTRLTTTEQTTLPHQPNIIYTTAEIHHDVLTPRPRRTQTEPVPHTRVFRQPPTMITDTAFAHIQQANHNTITTSPVSSVHNRLPAYGDTHQSTPLQQQVNDAPPVFGLPQQHVQATASVGTSAPNQQQHVSRPTAILHTSTSTTNQASTASDTMMSMMQQLMLSMQEERRMALEERRESRQQIDRLIAVIENSQRSNFEQRYRAGNNAPSAMSAGESVTPAPEITTTLPKVELPKFSGDIMEWPYFWQSFNLNVHERRGLSDCQKMDYLRQLLKGPAFDKIRGFGFDGSSYSEAIRILQSHYADDDIQRQAAWQSLLDLPNVLEDLTNLEKFTDDARTISTVLSSQGYTSQTLDTLVPTLVSKVPNYLVTKFHESRITQDKSTICITFGDLLDYLEKYVKVHRQSQYGGGGVKQRQSADRIKDKVRPKVNEFYSTKKSDQIVVPKRNMSCVFCGNQNHYSDQCPTHTQVEDRKKIIMDRNLCLNCLQEGHTSRQCTRQRACYYCHRSGHHSSLCLTKQRKPISSTQKNLGISVLSSDDMEEPKQATFAISNSSDGDVFLAVFPGQVRNTEQNISKNLTIYLDHGARFTCISERAADMLQLREIKRLVIETTRFGTNKPEKIECGLVKFEVVGKSGYRVQIDAYKIQNMTPVLTTDPHVLPEKIVQKLTHFDLLNPPRNISSRQNIDILLGMDYWYDFLGPQFTATKIESRLYIHHSPMGNILCGSHIAPDKSYLHKATSNTSMFCLTSTKAEADVDNLWKLEAIGITDEVPITKLDEKINQHFEETIQVNEDGRYEVVFPWKQKNIKLNSNYFLAKRRLSYTVKQLAPTEPSTHLAEYNKIIVDQLEKGVIEPVDATKKPDGPLVHYIAHFPVIRHDKVTTKVRIVYDASAKTKLEGKCLNDYLYTGPCQLTDLIALLLRFRKSRYAITSDIEKAFLQVGLQIQDRDCTRFLWLKDYNKLYSEENIQAYRFKRIPFGIVSSPYLLGATIQHHLRKYQNETVTQICQNIYVDNIIMHASSDEECTERYEVSKKLFKEAQMNLREFCSNNKDFINRIPQEDRDASPSTKVLGMLWDVNHDVLKCKVKPTDVQQFTKRSALKTLAAVFDPLGLISPLCIRAKMVQQEIWTQKFDWDDVLSDDLNKVLVNAFNDIGKAVNVSVPRQIFYGADRNRLVGFSDASEKAYGFCIYLITYHGEVLTSNLIFAKARVVPISPTMSIPKLELLAFQLASRGIRFIAKELQIDATCFLFTDSRVVLHWILSAKEYSAYVSRRKVEITSGLPIKFNYVNTKENPADLASRGCASLDNFWFKGPSWLTLSTDSWPEQYLPEKHNDIESEASVNSKATKKVKPPAVKTQVMVLTAKIEKPASPFGIDIAKYSSLGRLLNVTSYCCRFVKRTTEKDLVITTAEKTDSMRRWILFSQKKYFGKEFSALRLRKQTQVTRQLDVFIDEDGLLRCGGRLANAPLSYDQRFPLLLPKQDRLTQLLISKTHEDVAHFGSKTTLAAIRREFWIPHGLSEVKRVIQSCVLCRKLEGKGFRLPKMGQIPKERLTRAHAFQFVGLDYAGPLLIRNNKKSMHEKRWISVFVCFVTRAVHLEVVYSCGTASVIMAIKRFIARRGSPEVIISDNAAQFKNASRKLIMDTEAPEVEVKQFYAQKGIRWQFNPEAAPWTGGFYERLIGLIKRALRKALFKMTVTDEVFATILLEIEAVINTRPLLQPQTCLQDDEILTPAHIMSTSSQLCMKSNNLQNQNDDPDYIPDNVKKEDITTLYTQGIHKLEAFWRLWQRQYLSSLRESHQAYFKGKKGEVPRQPMIGEVVLINEEAPRSCWKMGTIHRLYMSPADSEVRFVDVKLANGNIVKRSVSCIVPLEVNC